MKPSTSSVSPKPNSRCLSTWSPQMCRTPEESCTRRCDSSRTGSSSSSGIEAITTAATRKVAASSRATAQPPRPAKSAAPSSGPNSR